ncbi:MAG: PQQ-binding-like beta-propeller repeat protein [Bacteroidota bacterium]
MKKSKYIIITITVFAFVLNLISCNKDKKENNNSDEVVTKSERQIYEFLAPSGTGFTSGCPTIVNDVLYIGTSSRDKNTNNYFYKFNLNLSKIWEYPLGSMQLKGSASLDSYGNIYFITDTAGIYPNGVGLKLYSLSNNGSLRWSKKISQHFILQGNKSVAISQDDNIYAPGDSLYAFDINGNKVWTYYNGNISGGVHQAPIIDPNGNIYFSSYGNIFSINKKGTLKWKYETGEVSPCKSSCAFNVDYSSVIVPTDRTLYSISTSTGSLNWKYNFNINADFRSTPAVDENNIIYIGSHGNGDAKDESTLYAVKADGTGIIWEYNLGGDIYSSPTLGSDGVVYIGSEGHNNTDDVHNRLHAFNMTTGSKLWSAQLGNDVVGGSPILANNGIIYIGTMHVADNVTFASGLFGFQTNGATLRTNCGSPTFQLSNAHNGRR